MKPLRARRLAEGPIIGPESQPRIGTNIQGPSVIRAPEWLPDPLGRYLLYFADHKGSFIRLAYADAIEGPWTIHEPGSLRLAESGFLVEDLVIDAETLERITTRYRAVLGDQVPASLHDDLVTAHIASLDVHVDDGRRDRDVPARPGGAGDREHEWRCQRRDPLPRLPRPTARRLPVLLSRRLVVRPRHAGPVLSVP